MILRSSLALFLLSAPLAEAACYADYKAKQDNPLRLHYGVAEVPSCSKAEAEAALRSRLDAAGWQLLTVLTTFDESGLSEREDSAGDYYLRF